MTLSQGLRQGQRLNFRSEGVPKDMDQDKD